MLDSIFQVGTLFNQQLDRLIGTDIDALPAPAAAVTDLGLITVHLDGIHEANALSAISTAETIVVHRNTDSREPVYLGTDLRCDIREDFPQAAARAAIADRHQPIRRSCSQPHRIQFVSPDHVHEPSLPAASDMFVSCFL